MNVNRICNVSYSNAISGLFAGLPNYMTYSNSVIYSKSKGDGKWSSLAIVATTVMIFVWGPSVASFVPRCMAGTVLLHVGIDLFMEGVIESYADYDKLEYAGVLLITGVMVVFGMDAALVAGVVAALSTYVAQSIVYQDPIRGVVSGARLRSSAWNRSAEAQQILLDSKKGRQRILIVQLQGHIFFGNSVKMTDDVKKILSEKRKACDEPAVGKNLNTYVHKIYVISTLEFVITQFSFYSILISYSVILDFTNVLGLDSSAAQSIAKLKSFILKNFNVDVIMFVTGHEDGFLCTYDLTTKVSDESDRKSIHVVEQTPTPAPGQHEHRLSLAAGALQSYIEAESKSSLIAEIPNSHVCETLDDALIFAEVSSLNRFVLYHVIT